MILVTGATGYIASHTIIDLFEQGYSVIGADNFCNSKKEVLDRIKQVSGKSIKFYEGDLRDYNFLETIFKDNKIETIIHFGGLKSNAESIENPALYYDVNLNSTRNLLKLMNKYGVKNIIFSGSATVYGSSDIVPVNETTSEVGNVLSPYGFTKYLNELIICDYCRQHNLKGITLRYFNPVGAHPSGLLGEDSGQSIPNNLFPYLTKVALGQLPYLRVYGDCYDTVDGTGLRDYIHVMDLASGHVAALKYIDNMSGYYDVFNLGTGRGTTVLELVHAFEQENGIKIPYKIVDVRPGDMAKSFADVSKANKILNWKAKYSINDCVRDAWNFQKNNPNGY